MPFKSKAQQRLFFAKEERGELPKGTAKRWARHTPNIKKLPEKKKANEIKAKTAVVVLDQFDAFYGSSSGRRLTTVLKAVKEAAGHDLATVEDVDVAVDIVDGSQKTAASWAKKLVKKYESEGKTVPEWLNKLSGGKEKTGMEKHAFLGRAMAGLGRRMAQGGVGRMFGGRVGRLGAKTGLSGVGRSLGRSMMRRGGLLEASGGLRGLMGRNPLTTAGIAGLTGMGLGAGLAGGQPASEPAAQPSTPPVFGGQQIDPRILQWLSMLQGGQMGYGMSPIGYGMPKWGMEKTAAMNLGAIGRGLRNVGRFSRVARPVRQGARNLLTGAQGTLRGLRSRFGRWRVNRQAARQARQSARNMRRAERATYRPDPLAEARLTQEIAGAGGRRWRSVSPGGKGYTPPPSMARRFGRAAVTGTRYGLPIAAGTALGANLFGGSGEQPEAAAQVSGNRQPDFVQRMMGGLGDYVGGDLGLESLGGMIRENPYASLGVGVGGGGLLLYLLYHLLSQRGGGQANPMAAMYG